MEMQAASSSNLACATTTALREDATNPELTSLRRITLVRDRAKRIRQIERELEAMKGTITKRWPEPRAKVRRRLRLPGN
jgi:hypothetical protein